MQPASMVIVADPSPGAPAAVAVAHGETVGSSSPTETRTGAALALTVAVDAFDVSRIALSFDTPDEQPAVVRGVRSPLRAAGRAP